MSVSAMKKLTAVVMKRDASYLLRRLMWLGCVQVTDSTPYVQLADSAPLASPSDESGGKPALPAVGSGALPVIGAAGSVGMSDPFADPEVKRLNAAIKLLKKYSRKSGGLFSRRPVLTVTEFDAHAESDTVADALTVADTVAGLSRRLEEIKAAKSAIALEIQALEPWLGYELPLSLTSTADTQLTLGYLPPGRDAGETNAALLDELGECHLESLAEGVAGSFCAFICHRSKADAAREPLFKAGFTKLDLAAYGDTTAASAMRTLGARSEKLDAEAEEIKQNLTDLTSELPALELAADIAATDAGCRASKMLTSDTAETTVLTGWVPAGAEALVNDELSKISKRNTIYWEFADPAEGDNPPVKLLNRSLFRPFESVIALYSLPAYGKYDPTVIMSIFFFVIFGLMLGDAIYGLILTVGGLLAVKLLDLDEGIKRLVKLFAICGVSCTISGLLFGSWLGDLPSAFNQNMLGGEALNVAVWFDMVTDPMTFLILALAVGALHLLTGMGIQMYLLFKQGRPFEAIFDVGSWFVLFAGIGLYFIVKPVGTVLAIAGALMLVLTQGRASKNPIMKLLKGIMSLYNIINYISDLLSYSRIMALGLASAVIASVINILAMLAGPNIVGFILMPVILIFGHLVNLLINLLGTFVHTSRLQYIEFFGKFYEDGGQPFKPVSPKLKHVRVDGETRD